MSDVTLDLKLTRHQAALLKHIVWEAMAYYQGRQQAADHVWVERGWALRAKDAADIGNIIEEASDGFPLTRDAFERVESDAHYDNGEFC